jgi:hypothetical protein
LRSPDDQRRHQRSSYAAADVAHEIDDARCARAFFFGDSDVACRRDRNEKKSDSDDVRDTQPRCKTEADL